MGESGAKAKARKKAPVKSRRDVESKQNEFLDVYSLYLATGLEWIKEEAILKAYELHTVDRDFSLEI